MKNNRKKIAVGLSGGVDSAVTAALLCREGHKVCAVTMQFWSGRIKLETNGGSACFGPGEAEDIAAAQEVAAFLGIPHQVIPLAEEYEEKVLNYYRHEYLAGRTPNPCIVCNALIKFGALLPALERFGINYDLLAMGHYARIDHDAATGIFRLRQGIDAHKDQSYFLHRLDQSQLAKICLPIGVWLKRDVIAEAKKLGLPRVTGKPESQDFLESNDHAAIFDGNQIRPGPIVDTGGKIIGTHRGVIYYTIGQRDGLGICADRRMYVKEIHADTNTIVIGGRDELLMSEASVADVHWICGTPPAKEFICLVRLRYRHDGAQATVTLTNEKRARIVFNEPQFAVTPGQAAVFYLGDEVLGGGWIS
jgi:tRNA-specific 2-thiouridylase